MPSLRLHTLALFALPLALAAAGCKDDEKSPTAPTATPTPTPVAGNTGSTPQVRGTERLAWDQTGDVSTLRFRAYVDGKAVDLTGATCSASGSGSVCQAALPAMSDGVHSIEVVNVSNTGAESDRSAALTVQKVSPSASLSSRALAAAASGSLRMPSVITIADGLSFTADIVATGVRAPAQLAALPDGRLMLSDADGNVRVVHPGEVETREAALEAGALTSAPVGAMGLATHPDFARNGFVYLSLLEEGRDGQRLRVVRLREVADTLGEAATLFEARVAGDASASQAGPRMAFGPDRLLYVMLPPGLEFVNEPAASAPLASILRLNDEGRVAWGEGLSGVTSTPLAFTWHPSTGALWVMLRGENGAAAVRSLDRQDRARAMRAQTPALRALEGTGSTAGTLLLQSAPDDLLVAQAVLGIRADGSKGIVRLALPFQTLDAGMPDRVGDVVAGDGGTLFVVTNNGLVDGAAGTSDVVIRLTPVKASAAR